MLSLILYLNFKLGDFPFVGTRGLQTEAKIDKLICVVSIQGMKHTKLQYSDLLQTYKTVGWFKGIFQSN